MYIVIPAVLPGIVLPQHALVPHAVLFAYAAGGCVAFADGAVHAVRLRLQKHIADHAAHSLRHAALSAICRGDVIAKLQIAVIRADVPALHPPDGLTVQGDDPMEPEGLCRLFSHGGERLFRLLQ